MANNDSFFDSFNEENFDDRFDQDNRDSSNAEFAHETRSYSVNDDSGNSGDEELAPQQNVDYGPLELKIEKRN